MPCERLRLERIRTFDPVIRIGANVLKLLSGERRFVSGERLYGAVNGRAAAGSGTGKQTRVRILNGKYLKQILRGMRNFWGLCRIPSNHM